MAIYTTLEAVEKQMNRSGARFWWVYDSDKTCISAYKEKTGTIEDSFLELKELVENQEGDYVIISVRSKLPNATEDGAAYKKGGDNRSGEKFEFRVRVKQAAGLAGTGRSGSMDAGLHGLYTMLADMKADNVRIGKDAEINALKKELEDSKKEKGSGSYTETMIDHIAKEFVKNMVGTKETKVIAEPVSDAPKAENYNLDDKDKSKLISEGLGHVASVMKGDTYALIDKLGKMAKDEPDAFKMQAKIILGDE